MFVGPGLMLVEDVGPASVNTLDVVFVRFTIVSIPFCLLTSGQNWKTGNEEKRKQIFVQSSALFVLARYPEADLSGFLGSVLLLSQYVVILGGKINPGVYWHLSSY